MKLRNFVVWMVPALVVGLCGCGVRRPPAGGVASTDAGASPLLISRTPDVSAGNVWFYDPISLVFSVALDPATVNDDAISIQIDGASQPENVALSADGRTVTVALQTPPTLATAEATAEITIRDTLLSTRGEAFAGDKWSWHLPLWHVSEPAIGNGSTAPSPAIALDTANEPFVTWLSGVGPSRSLLVSVWNAGAWSNVGAKLNGGDTSSPSAASIDIDATGRPVVGWTEADGTSLGSVYAKAWDGSAWTLLGGQAIGSSGAPPALASDSQRRPVVAFLANDTALDVRRWTSGAWQALGTPLSVPADVVHGFALAMSADSPVVAYYDANQDVAVQRWDGTSWSLVGKPIDRERTSSTGRPSLAAAADGTLFVGYLDGDPVSNNAYARRYGTGDTDWLPQGAALDVVLDAEATSIEVRADNENRLVAAWAETYGGVSKTYVVRFVGAGFRNLGPALAANPESAPTSGASALTPTLALATDSHGNPQVAYQGPMGLALRRYNGSPDTPYGIAARLSTASCVIPDETDPAFPLTISETGCYADVAGHRVSPSAVRFEINSPLWSDGATKHRFIFLPDGKSITYTDTGSWVMPVGTIVMKEFSYRAELTDPESLFPMETRFLIKRCEEGDCPQPFQPYSYLWNAAGTEGTLLPGDAFMSHDWPYKNNGVAAIHTHPYPARSECLVCHNPAAGRVLGLETAQLNRIQDYGATIDNQLRAMNRIGLFGDTFPDAQPESHRRVPTPNDPRFSLQERVLGYFHSNCSDCHIPTGPCPQIDFRFFATGLTPTNICDELVAGDHTKPGTKSMLNGVPGIFERDASRVAGIQMPPMATLIPDNRQLALTQRWIDSLTSCP